MTDQETSILMAKAEQLSRSMWPLLENKSTCGHMEQEDLVQDAILVYLEKYAGKCPAEVLLGAYIHNKVRQTMLNIVQKAVGRENAGLR